MRQTAQTIDTAAGMAPVDSAASAASVPSSSVSALAPSSLSSSSSSSTAKSGSLSSLFAGGVVSGEMASSNSAAMAVGATGSTTEVNAAQAPPPPLTVNSESATPLPSPFASSSTQLSQFPLTANPSSLALALGSGLAISAAATGAAVASPAPSSASAAAAAALARRPSGLASSMTSAAAAAGGAAAMMVPAAAVSASEVSGASSSVIFTPSSMAQDTAGHRATRSLSFSMTSTRAAGSAAAGTAGASTSVPSTAAFGGGSILTLFDPSAVSPDLSSASNTHASSASFRFSSSASPAHGREHGSARAFSPLPSNPAAAQAAAAAAAAGPLAQAPPPVPAVSPTPRKGFTSGASAKMSSIRARIREQISGMRREKAARDQEEVVREWSACLAKWNQYQPAVSGVASLNGLSAKDLAANQKKLSGLLLSSGIPPHMRASVWLLMIGNGLGLTPQAFEDLRASCAEKRKEYEAWRKQTNSNHLNAKHRQLAEAEAAAAAAAAATAAVAASTTDATASPSSSSAASMPTFHPSPSPSPSSTAAAAGSETPQSTSTSSSNFSSASSFLDASSSSDVSLDPSCAMFSLIDQDLPRTFPELAFFHADGPYETPLRVVLEATAAFRAQRERERIQALAAQEMGDPALLGGAAAAGAGWNADGTGSAPASTPLVPPVPLPVLESSSASSSGYVQGMSFLASILFLALGDDPFLAFVALTNLLENPAEPLSQLFSMRAEIMEDWLLRFDAQFASSLPKLHAHFATNIGLTADMYLYKWIFSVYAQSLHLDAVFRVWDVFLWESFKNRGSGGVATQATLGAGNAVSSVWALAATAALSAAKGDKKAAGTVAAASTVSTAASGSASPTSVPSAASAASVSVSPPPPTAASSSVSASSAMHVHSGHGFPFLFRVALGILSMFSDALCEVGFEECLHFLHHLPGKLSAQSDPATDMPLDIDLLFQHVRTIKMEPHIWSGKMQS